MSLPAETHPQNPVPSCMTSILKYVPEILAGVRTSSTTYDVSETAFANSATSTVFTYWSARTDRIMKTFLMYKDTYLSPNYAKVLSEDLDSDLKTLTLLK